MYAGTTMLCLARPAFASSSRAATRSLHRGAGPAATARNADPAACFVVQGASRGLGLEMARQLLHGRFAGTVVATCRRPESATALRELAESSGGRLHCVAYDPELGDEAGAQTAADAVRELSGGRVDALVNAAGMLHDEAAGHMPEKALREVSAEWLRRSFAVHTVGPLLLTQALEPLLRVRKKDERPPSVVVNISARVGSIEDNRAGGWFSYRISKAAQNQATRTAALELARHRCWLMALHPGTVDTDLSAPFQSRLPAGQLRPLGVAAGQLLDVIDAMEESDAGTFHAWDRERLPF